jgi:hypothetical protein
MFMNIIRPNNGNKNATVVRPKQAQQPQLPAKIEAEDLSPPATRGFKVIPEDFVLNGLIRKALNALKKGVYWDRGSIINIEV